MIGIVENVQSGHCFIRSDEGWTRYFAAGVDCDDGGVPDLHVRVEFQPDDTDPRGPRARRVVVIAEPPPDIVRECRDCGAELVIDPGQQAWFTARQLALPVRCESCRQARRAARA